MERGEGREAANRDMAATVLCHAPCLSLHRSRRVSLSTVRLGTMPGWLARTLRPTRSYNFSLSLSLSRSLSNCLDCLVPPSSSFHYSTCAFPTSTLCLYRAMLRIRKNYLCPALSILETVNNFFFVRVRNPKI